MHVSHFMPRVCWTWPAAWVPGYGSPTIHPQLHLPVQHRTLRCRRAWAGHKSGSRTPERKPSRAHIQRPPLPHCSIRSCHCPAWNSLGPPPFCHGPWAAPTFRIHRARVYRAMWGHTPGHGGAFAHGRLYLTQPYQAECPLKRKWLRVNLGTRQGALPARSTQ